MRVIHDPKRIVALEKEFLKCLRQKFSKKINARVGHPGGSFPGTLELYQSEQCWFHFTKQHNRYWLGFGLGVPVKGSLESITTEINMPFDGVNRRIAGVFAEDDTGNYYVLHRGKIGGGRKGVGKELFKNRFKGQFIEVLDKDRLSEFALVAALASPRFCDQIVNFVRQVEEIKNNRNNQSDITKHPNGHDLEFSSEFSGKKSYSLSAEIEASCDHGIVVETLRNELKKLEFKTGNNRYIDLFSIQNEEIHHIFEVKTSTNRTSLYKAIGQLLLYNLQHDGKGDLYLVFPYAAPNSIENYLNQLGIRLLHYSWEKDKPVFSNLSKALDMSTHSLSMV